ncbi:MAG: hypothetical protein NXI04_10875 [Planctomycetaceae bacterium]|nr:hypothetical protein [Planctomycetaceae bacterium]
MASAESRSDSSVHLWRRGTTFSTTVWIALIGGFVIGRFAAWPLWPTDLWDHINYGRYILETGSIPATEPLLPAAEGARFVATAWLSQVMMAVLADTPWLGLAALQFVYALLVAVAVTAVVATVFRRCQRYVPAIVAAAAFLAINWEQLKIIRPQLLGVPCFAVLLMLLSRSRRLSGRSLVAVSLMFVVWANCHGSFAVGLTLIGLDIAGRAADLCHRTGSVRAVAHSRLIRQRVQLLGLCCLAGLLNPFGAEIYLEVLRVGRHPNIDSMFEWAPLSLSMRQGRATAVVTILWLASIPATPARRRICTLLPLLFFGVLAVWSSRMLNWYAPVVAVSLGGQLAAIARTWRRMPGPDADNRHPRWTLASSLLLLMLFCRTNWGAACLHLRNVQPAEVLARYTPLQITRFLKNSDLPPGQALIPAEWAGFVMYSLEGRLQSYVNLHVHVIPETVWQEYLSLLRGPSDLSARLAQLNINLVVVDSRRHRRLWQRLRKSDDFSEIYADPQGTVFRRR